MTRIAYVFSGKGAGAGMMLSSSMGPMGVAIGLAIDEGIGKEIDETARGSGFLIEDCVRAAFQQSGKHLSIRVKRYGFILMRGDYSEETVMPELVLNVAAEDETLTLLYPKDFALHGELKGLATYSLSEVENRG